jgi:stalled ribosome alternative rescue factor ArfA
MAQPTKESAVKRALADPLYKQRVVRNRKKYSRKIKNGRVS